MPGRAAARLLVCLLAGLACMPSGSRPGGSAVNPELVVWQFARGYGGPGGARLARLFLPEADVRLAGLGTSARGRRGIARLLDYARAVEASLSLSGLERSGDTVTCRLAEDNAWLRALGADSLRYAARFVFRGARIADAEFRLLPGSKSALGRTAMPFARWVRKQEPGAIEQLLPGGRPELTGANARRLRELISRWRAN
ncbi:MAG: hypothetical protein R6X14_07155 [bacterium]